MSSVHENSLNMKPPTSPVQQFYRRELPQECIPFCSDEGKRIFQEALLEGHMETYFVLASQFSTQEEPAFCGLTTLVMVLNALEVDPKKIWKSPWRWYHEQMLDCCVPMEVIEKSGITFDQFACLAICNTLEVQSFRIGPETSEKKFRDLIATKTRTATDVVVVSYFRGALGQTGTGHFSPIGGYHPGRDLILILDVARFKYPPHWVTVSQLYQAMTFADSSTGLSRGYLLLNKSPSQPTLLFRFSTRVSITRPGQLVNTAMAEGIKVWQDYLGQPLDHGAVTDDDELLASAVNNLMKTIGNFSYDDILLTTQCEANDDISKEHQSAVVNIIQALESLPLFSLIKEAVRESDSAVKVSDSSEQSVTNCWLLKCTTARAHYITMLVLFWPYPEVSGCLGTWLLKLVDHQLNICSAIGHQLLQNEVRQLRQQFRSVLGYVNTCCNCHCDSNTA